MTDSTDSAETGQVDLLADLTERLQDRVTETDFDSVDAYAAFALDQLLDEVESLEEDGRPAVGGAGAGADAGGNADGNAGVDAGKNAGGNAGTDADGNTGRDAGAGTGAGDSPSEVADEDSVTDGESSTGAERSEAVEERLDSLGYL